MTGMPVLVVEDDPNIARMVARIISRESWEVDMVDRVSDAESRIAARSYAAVILDLMLPGRPGQELLAYLRGAYPALLRRTIVMTASPLHIKNLDLEEIGGALTKPFDIEDLLELMRRIGREGQR